MNITNTFNDLTFTFLTLNIFGKCSTCTYQWHHNYVPSNNLTRLYTVSTTSKRICIYLVTDSCSAEWQYFSCAVYKFAYLLTYLLYIDQQLHS